MIEGEIFNQKYKIIGKLDQGYTADVYKIECLETANPYALKVIKKAYLEERPQRYSEVEREMKISRMLKHENFVSTIECGKNYQVMDFVENGQVFDLIQKCVNVGEDGGRMFMRQMVQAIEYLHEQKGIVHRDIKLENMLITKDLTIKFADFGFATDMFIDNLTEFRGTKAYMAPEIKLGQTYKGKEVDMFSIGVVLFIMVHGMYPFKETVHDEKHKQHINGFYGLTQNNVEQYWRSFDRYQMSSPEFKDFIIKFFKLRGSERITLDEIKKHPWYTMESNISDNQIKRDIIRKFEENGGEKGKFMVEDEQIKIAIDELDIESRTTSVDDGSLEKFYQIGSEHRQIEIQVDDVDSSQNTSVSTEIEVDENHKCNENEGQVVTKKKGKRIRKTTTFKSIKNGKFKAKPESFRCTKKKIINNQKKKIFGHF